MTGAAVWWCNAFVGPGEGGNPTAVVLAEDAIPDDECAAIARSLRAPDTVFVRGAGGPRVEMRFFSPIEGEMAFCGQALVAAGAALQRAGKIVGAGAGGARIAVTTRAGDVVVAHDAGDPRWWFLSPRTQVRDVTAARPAPLGALSPALDGGAPPRIVDSGRVRAFQDVGDAAALEAIALPAERVDRFCRDRQLSGVCLYARAPGGAVRLRVFTVSLGGAEDVATGGAVLGLGAILDPGAGAIDVVQGIGHPLRRGRLALRAEGDPGALAVGGEVQVVACGRLADM